MDVQTAKNEARKGWSISKRIALVESEAQTRGININANMSNIAREVERAEKKVDRV